MGKELQKYYFYYKTSVKSKFYHKATGPNRSSLNKTRKWHQKHGDIVGPVKKISKPYLA